MASLSGVGLSCPWKLSKRPSSIPSPSSFSSSSSWSTSLNRLSVNMVASVDEKKKTFTLKKSEEAFNAAKDLMHRGVNSPVRAFKSVGRQPIIIDSVKGSHMWDIDGNEYIDYVGLWGPAIIGHADDEVLAALAEAMKKGTSFGAPCLLENVLAEMVISAVPSIKMVRFVNSGTEACMGMLHLSRAFTYKMSIHATKETHKSINRDTSRNLNFHENLLSYLYCPLDVFRRMGQACKIGFKL